MRKPLSPFWTWGGVALALVALLFFVIFTPPSLLRKLDYVGAAVCHRLPEHSFFVAGEQLPLCQRCTGTFPGALTGLLLQWGLLRRRRAGRFARWWVWVLVGIFFVAWGFDGVNSMLYSIGRSIQVGDLSLAALYEPQPLLRLLTGTLVGLGMSIVLVAAFNQTFWQDPLDEATVRNGRDFSLLLAVELAQAALIFLGPDWLLYPLGLYSALSVVALFTLLGAMLWVMTLGREQSYRRWREIWLPLLWGLVFAGLIIGAMDLMRYQLTGTIDGLPQL